MHDIDLIPESYRRAGAQRRWLILLGCSTAAVVVISVAGRLGFGYANAQVAAEIQSLQEQQTITVAQRDELARLQGQRGDYQQQLRLLSSLRSGTAAENLFHIIDEVLLEEELWFLKWQFRRAGISSDTPGRAVETGYFLVVPDEMSGNEGESWRVETHMEITGQATDHAALSRFVRRLFGRQEIYDVRVKRTELHRYRQRTVVDFDLTVIINSRIAG